MKPSIGPIAANERSHPARRTWSLLLGTATTYAGARFVAGAVARAVGARSPEFNLPGELTAAVLVGATLVALAPRVAGSAPFRTGVLGLVLFVSVAAVMLEGSAFAPGLSPVASLPSGLVLQFVVSLVTAGVAVAASPAAAEPSTAARLSRVRVAWRVGAAALVYVIAYFVTGALNYMLVTRPYYAAHAGGLTTPQPSVVLVVAVIEGLLMTLGTIPLARGLTGSWRTRQLACGLALWVLGGVVPLLQASTLPDVLRIASAVEILLQKVPLGIAVVRLFGTSTMPSTGPIPPGGLREVGR